MTELDIFRSTVKQIKAYHFALSMIGWDANTEAPRASSERRSEMASLLSKELFLIQTSEKYQQSILFLYENLESYDDLIQREIKKAKKDIDKIKNIPENEYIDYHRLISASQMIWEDAKANNDYHSFKSNLSKIINYTKKFALYYDSSTHPYDTLLQDYEEGMTTKEYDQFFDALKKDLVPFVKHIIQKSKPNDDLIIKGKFEKEKQKEFSQYLLDEFGFDRNKGLLKESVHPFTWNTSPNDVRLTTKYLEDYIFSSIYSTAHELGHAVYEQQISSAYDDTLLSGGTSMGIHESQSRFYENNIGRSLAFWETHLDRLKELFPTQLSHLSTYDMYKASNKVESSLIRIEADELTYSLHIMVRYDIERMLFSEEISVDELPSIWNDLMEKYLGVRPNNDSEGVLQDVHWSDGMFGYFPTYALGSAYSAQIYHAMKKDLDVDDCIKNHSLTKINLWLKEKIHQYGSSKTPKELMMMVTSEPFNPKYYIEYLIEKYSKIYN